MSDPAQSNINKEVYALFMLQCSSSAFEFTIDTRQVTSLFRILSIGVCYVSIVLISTHHLHCSKMHFKWWSSGYNYIHVQQIYGLIAVLHRHMYIP